MISSNKIIITSFLGIIITVVSYGLYKFIPATYYWFYKSMTKEETLHRPLLAEGVVATEPSGDVRTNCRPKMSLMYLSNSAVSSGDIIELHGKWGALTSNKVPLIVTPGYPHRRLEVIKWTDKVIRVRIPNWLNKGKHKIYVNCMTQPPHKASYILTVRKEIQIK
jgi:hypothetical protein